MHRAITKIGSQRLTEIDEVSARLTVLETVVKQLITHMAVRDDDPQRWVQTRRTLAMSAIDARIPQHAALLRTLTEAFFDQPAEVARDYGRPLDPATPHALAR
jgi:hypothetical protein